MVKNHIDISDFSKAEMLENDVNGKYSDLKTINSKNSNSSQKFCLKNELIAQLENKLDDRKEVMEINRIIENAIHWSLVNG